MPLNNQTTTVQQIVDICSLHTNLQSFFNVGGVTNEPGLTMANLTIQSLLIQTTPWKFNRREMCGTDRGGQGNFFVTNYGIQDYQFAGASSFALQGGTNNPAAATLDLNASPVNGGTAAITTASGVMTVQTLDQHPFIQGQTVYMAGLSDLRFNSVLSMNQATRSVAWTQGYVITSVPDVFHFTAAAPAGCSATITNIAVLNNVVTFAATNGYTAGETFIPTGITTKTYLNGQLLTVLTATSSQITATFAHADDAGAADTGTMNLCTGAPGINDWGWMESASWQEINSTQLPQPVTPIIAVRELPPAYSASGDKLYIAMMADFQNGVLKMRLSEPVFYQGQINVTYQKRAPKMTSPQSVFPWPDNLNLVLFEVLMARAYRYARGITESDLRTQQAIAAQTVANAFAAEDREDSIYGISGITLMR